MSRRVTAAICRGADRCGPGHRHRAAPLAAARDPASPGPRPSVEEAVGDVGKPGTAAFGPQRRVEIGSQEEGPAHTPGGPAQ